MGGCARRSVLRVVVALAAAAIAFCTSAASSLAAGSPIALSVQYGYHNSVKNGYWMPVSVDVTNSGPDFEGTLEVQASNSSNGPPVGSAVYEAPVSLAAGATKHYRTYVAQDFPGPVKVRVMRGGSEVTSAAATSTNTFSGLLIGVLSDQPAALDALGALHPGGQAPIVVHLAGADLPDSVPVLRAFDVIAIDNFATDTLTAAQKTALNDYVLQGGALLLGTGGAWHKTLAGLAGAMVPMQVTGSTVLASATALGGAPGVEIGTGTLNPGAVAWLSENGQPLLVESQVGRGMVMLATFDWAQDSVGAWTGYTSTLRQVVVRLTYGNPANPTTTGPAIGKFGAGTNVSIATKGGALTQALGNLPALDLPAWWLIGALVFVYVLLVGPVNYYVLRATGRRALAWVTVPAIAVVASGGAYGTSVLTKGTSVLANEVSVIHVQQGSDRAYQEQYTGIITPTRGDYVVGTGGSRMLVSPIYYYTGLVGNNPNLASMRVNTVSSEVTLPGMTAFTLRGFAGEGMLGHAPDLSGQARMVGGQLVGSIKNASSIAFTDGVVISGNSYQKIGEMRPGGDASFSLTPAQSTINGPPVTMTIYPSQFGPMGMGPNNTSAATEREMEVRSAVLSTVVPNAYSGLPSTTQPIVVLWTQQPFQSVTVNGQHPRTFVDSAVVLTLPIQQVGAGALPAGVVQGRMIDIDADTSQGPPGMLIAQNGSATYSFRPLLASGTHLTQASITNTNPYGKGFLGPTATTAPVKAEAWDWAGADWVDLSYQETGTTVIPDTAVNPTTGEVRIKLSSTGQFATGWLSLAGTVA